MNFWKKTIAISATALFATGVLAADGSKERRAELAEKMKAHLEERFNELDSNRDGIVSHVEMMLKAQEKFAEFDKNRDGYLTLEELPKLMPIPEHARERMKKRAERMKERMDERREDFHPDDMLNTSGPHHGRFEGRPTRLHFIAKHDRDGDERISLEEFAAKPVGHFKRMDMNGDGEVTKAELLEAAKAHRMKKSKGHRMQPHFRR